MMKAKLGRVFATALLVTASVAQAEDIALSEPTVSRGQGWSTLSGKTVGNGSTVIQGQLGWPGLSGTLLIGVAPKLDLGGKLTFNYGEEGIVTRVVPGLKLQGVLRVELLETSRINLGLKFEPGPIFYFEGPNTTRIGLALPIGLTLGIPVGSAVMVNAGLDLPMYVFFGPDGGLNFPIMVGGGMEYFISHNLAINFNLRMGPTAGNYYYYNPYYYPFNRGYYYTAPFTLEALMGIAFKL